MANFREWIDMSGASQISFMNLRSFGPGLPAIGSAYEGGFFAGQIGVGGVATHNLVVGPLSTASTLLQWKTTNTATDGTSSTIDGPANTAAMIAAGAADHPAGQFCDNLVTGGFSDWYMPARYELDVCYFNLKPTTTTNSTATGINPNSIPERTVNYTAGNPAQTSAAIFRTGGSEAFSLATTDVYWSSTAFSASNPVGINLASGSPYTIGGKSYSRGVRAIRRVPI